MMISIHLTKSSLHFLHRGNGLCMSTLVYSYDSRVQMHNVIYELTPIHGTTQRARSIGVLLLAATLASLCGEAN